MKHSAYLVTDWLLGRYAMEKIASLQQEILKTLNETHNATEALSQAYEALTDEQKIAFILAGGVPSLLYSSHQHIQQMRTGSDTETGQLPVLC